MQDLSKKRRLHVAHVRASADARNPFPSLFRILDSALGHDSVVVLPELGP